jgi:hypothetical protein
LTPLFAGGKGVSSSSSSFVLRRRRVGHCLLDCIGIIG